MEEGPHLGVEGLDGPLGALPPSSPPHLQPSSPLSSPLTVLNELQYHWPPFTTGTLPSSPLSSPPDSPTPRSRTLALPNSSLNQGGVLNNTVNHEGSSNDDPFVRSSPILSQEDKRRKAQKQRDLNREERARRKLEDERKRRIQAFEQCLTILSTNNLTFAELTEYVLFDEGQTAKWRYKKFFDKPELVTNLLDLLASSKVDKLCSTAVKEWAEGLVMQTITKEIKAAAKTGDLHLTERAIDSSFASGLSFDELKGMVRRNCPTFLKMLVGVTTTSRQEAAASEERKAAKEHAAAFVILNLLGARSQKNSYARHVMGLYLYSTGATRQQISVLNHLGLSVSYITLAGRGNKAENLLTSQSALASGVRRTASASSIAGANRKYRLGTLEALSESMRKVTREVAATNLYALVYDNINMLWKVAEQIIGRTDSMENGTCATVVSLFGARLDDLSAVELERKFSKAPELKASDILLTEDEYKFTRRCLIHTILRIVVTYGGPRLEAFRKDLQADQPQSPFKVEVHKSEIYPLPAMNINEASTMGNAEVVDAVMEELEVDTTKPDFCVNLKLLAGDQLSIARLRAVLAARAGNEGGAPSLRWAIFIPGLFHCKIAAVNGFIQTHFGHPNRDLMDPASLSSHNTLLQRKPIVLSSLPPFRTCRDLIFVSLYARVLHCLLKVSDSDSLDSFSDGLTWSALCDHAEAAFDTFTNGRLVESLRGSRRQEDEAQRSAPGERERSGTAGDMIFENAVLFLRDGLLLREFSDAIKTGDSGRVLLVLRLWAFSY